MASYPIRIVGDPVLTQRSNEVTDIDGRFVKLVKGMFDSLYHSDSGLGLAAPQVGVQKRFFVYDLEHGEDPQVLINPRITGSDGEWWYSEGCLSIPGLYFEICRPKTVEVTALNLDGDEVSFEADEIFARLMQHEIDHLDGVLMLEHLDDEQLNEAKKAIREMQLARAEAEPAPRRGFSLR
jgi:peptide deformylase